MDVRINGFVLLVIGILVVLYRTKFASLIFWYHQRRWSKRNLSKGRIQEYPEKAWTIGNKLTQIIIVIVGVFFIVIGAKIILSGSGSKKQMSVNVIHHSEEMAAQKAQRFADIAFVRHEYESAYGLLSESLKKELSYENFSREIENIHSRGFPTKVYATDYEPIPGQKAMYVFLQGDSGTEKIYYRFVMDGTKEMDYRIASINRSELPYVLSKLSNPLKIDYNE